LHEIASRLPVKGGDVGTFLVRRDHIEVTTVAAVRREIYGKQYKGPTLQIVKVEFKKRRLDEALADLAEKAGVNIVIDRRAGSLAEKPVSLKVANMDVDDVVRLLTAMAGLRAYRVDNVFLVTPIWHERELQQREPDRQRQFAAPP
jgi:hypothetical protein